MMISHPAALIGLSVILPVYNKERHRFIRGIASRLGFHQTGLSYHRNERFAGSPKYNTLTSIRLVLDGITSFSTVPLKPFELSRICHPYKQIPPLPLAMIRQYIGRISEESKNRPLCIIDKRYQMFSEFDIHARSYETLLAASIKVLGYDSSYFDHHKIKELHRIVGKYYTGNIRFLNFGCGIGKSEPYIRQYFSQAEIHSADTSTESLKSAARRNEKTNVTFHHIENLEHFEPGGLFDIIFVANLFNHIPAEQHTATLKKLKQLLSPQGRLLVFEHNPWNPLTRRAFNTLEFHKGCVMISAPRFKKIARESGFKNIRINYTFFFPHALKAFIPLEKYMTKIAMGAEYYAICS